MIGPGTKSRPSIGGRRPSTVPLACIIAGLLLAAVIVDPLRNVVALDDGWAYARTVESLLQAGHYRLDDWSAASMPVQILQAAGLSTIFGYSLGVLRMSTVGMLAVALVSFYWLTREFGASRATGIVATLCLLASPLVLQLGFTFMSDIHFLGWLLAALLLYCRGFRRSANGLIVLGSLAASCAIGTRQFGVAILAGLVLAWIIAGPAIRPRLRMVVLAVSIPIAALTWQIINGVGEPTFAQAVRLGQQELFVGLPAGVIAQEFLWRAAIVFQYVGIGVAPAAPLLCAAAFRYARTSTRRALRLTMMVLLSAIGLCAVLVTRSPVYGGDESSGLWPALGMPWLLRNYLPDSMYRSVDLAGIVAASVLAAVIALKVATLQRLRSYDFGSNCIIFTAVSLFALHMVYVQMNDTYAVPFIAFSLLLLAVHHPTPNLSTRGVAIAAGFALAVTVLVSLWIRAIDSEQAALWTASERLRAAGVRTGDIRESFCNWPYYRGSFDDWLTAGAPGYELSLDRADGNTFVESFLRWTAVESESASYRVQVHPESDPRWQLIARDSYRDFSLQRREVYTYRAVMSSPGSG